MNEIEKRLADLEKYFADWQRHQLTNAKENDARELALYTIVSELAQRLGLSSAEVRQHYKIRTAWMLDRLLQKVESKEPTVAAEIDKRKIDEVPTADGYPPLFPPASPT